MLKKYWKQEPPMSNDKLIKLVLHDNQEVISLVQVSSILDNTTCSTQKGTYLGGILVNLELHQDH
jgi:hypothetical protein